jgi:hypothetical protein
MGEGMTPKPAYHVLVAEFFRQHPHTWINGLQIARFAGAYAWRSRISDARRLHGLMIENRLRTLDGGEVISEYRYVPAAAPRQAGLFA